MTKKIFAPVYWIYFKPKTSMEAITEIIRDLEIKYPEVIIKTEFHASREIDN